MKTRILLISLLFVFLFSVQAVTAETDDDGNLTSENIDLSICDNTNDVISEKQSNNPDEILNASNELDVLGSVGTYPQLEDEIANGGDIVELQYDNYIYRGYGGSTI